ncbi:MAG: hypothetical protein CRN43_20435 [Candidatus Nephrothrix sp. EaCA]|nr:MAG: hypothetical protein CRN43_20435 [Candidatus Nephrothrix sp. EaCA]
MHGHAGHKAGQAWLVRLRGMEYQKCILCIEGGTGQTLGGDHRGPGPRMILTARGPHTWSAHIHTCIYIFQQVSNAITLQPVSIAVRINTGGQQRNTNRATLK